MVMYSYLLFDQIDKVEGKRGLKDRNVIYAKKNFGERKPGSEICVS